MCHGNPLFVVSVSIVDVSTPDHPHGAMLQASVSPPTAAISNVSVWCHIGSDCASKLVKCYQVIVVASATLCRPYIKICNG